MHYLSVLSYEPYRVFGFPPVILTTYLLLHLIILYTGYFSPSLVWYIPWRSVMFLELKMKLTPLFGDPSCWTEYQNLLMKPNSQLSSNISRFHSRHLYSRRFSVFLFSFLITPGFRIRRPYYVYRLRTF